MRALKQKKEHNVGIGNSTNTYFKFRYFNDSNKSLNVIYKLYTNLPLHYAILRNL